MSGTFQVLNKLQLLNCCLKSTAEPNYPLQSESKNSRALSQC